jgi:hypothetical protein
MARVYLARVDEPTTESLAAAVERARLWLGEPTLDGDVRAVAAPRWGRLSRRKLESLVRGLAGRPQQRLGFIGRSGEVFRYQLSVGSDRRHDRLPARAELYRLEGLVLAPVLSVDLGAEGVGGAVLLAARRLAQVNLDRLDLDARGEILAEVLEVATADLVVGDGTRARLGLAPSTSPRPLGLVLVADDALAHDATWARILGIDPAEVPWMATAAARGLGQIDGLEVGGDEPLAFFRRRVQGFASPIPSLDTLPGRWAADHGAALPIQVLPSRHVTVGAERLLCWLSALAEDPRLREQLPGKPTVAVIAGARATGELPAVDRVLTVGPEALQSLLADVMVRRARAWPRIRGGSWGLSGQIWTVTLQEGRRLRVAALDDAAPSDRAIRDALAQLGLRLKAAPTGGSDGASALSRLRRHPLPTAVVHARRIPRLKDRAWRQRWQPTEQLRLRAPEEADGD